jgi:hypothetical protein
VAARASTTTARSAWPAHARIRADGARYGSHVSSAPIPSRQAETLAGFLASASIFVSLAGIAYRPLRLVPVAAVLALIAVGIGGRSERLATYAVMIAAVSFALGLAVAVVTSNPLW